MGRKAYKWVVRDWVRLTDLEAGAAMLGSMRFTRNLEPQVLDGPAGDRILVIAPHPDDEVIGPGGTLIRAARRGARVRVLYLTSGEADETAERETEARAVCDSLGFEYEFLGHAVLGIPLEETAKQLAETAASFQPNAQFLPFALDDHDDHRRASEVVLSAHRQSRLEGSIATWAYQVYGTVLPNVIVDITDLADEKAAAIRLYESQMRRRDWAHVALGANALSSRLLPGHSKASFAEPYFVLPLSEYARHCAVYFDHAGPGAYYSDRYTPDRDDG